MVDVVMDMMQGRDINQDFFIKKWAAGFVPSPV